MTLMSELIRLHKNFRQKGEKTRIKNRIRLSNRQTLIISQYTPQNV